MHATSSITDKPSVWRDVLVGVAANDARPLGEARTHGLVREFFRPITCQNIERVGGVRYSRVLVTDV